MADGNNSRMPSRPCSHTASHATARMPSHAPSRTLLLGVARHGNVPQHGNTTHGSVTATPRTAATSALPHATRSPICPCVLTPARPPPAIRRLTARRSHAGHPPLARCPHAAHMLATRRSHAARTPLTCWPHAARTLPARRSHAAPTARPLPTCRPPLGASVIYFRFHACIQDYLRRYVLQQVVVHSWSVNPTTLRAARTLTARRSHAACAPLARCPRAARTLPARPSHAAHAPRSHAPLARCPRATRTLPTRRLHAARAPLTHCLHAACLRACTYIAFVVYTHDSIHHYLLL
jgi:hypothetical protein